MRGRRCGGGRGVRRRGAPAFSFSPLLHAAALLTHAPHSPPPLRASFVSQGKRELVVEDISRALGGRLKPADHKYSEL